MIRRYTATLRSTLMAVDFGGAVLLFVLVSVARYGAQWQAAWHRLGFDPWLAAAAYGAAWVVIVWLHGLYRLRARYSIRSEAVALLRATVILGLAITTLLFVINVSNASRLLLLALLVSSVSIAIAARLILRTLLGGLRKRGRLTHLVLIAGAGSAAQDFADRIERHVDLGLRVVGHLSGPDGRAAELTRPVLGTIEQVEDVLHDRVIDEVVVCLPVMAWDLVEPITRLCAGEGKIVRIPAGGGPPVVGGYSEDFDGLTVASLVYGPDRAVGLFIKRVVDVTLAGILLVVLSPLLIGIALVIWRRDGPSALYRQWRIGLNGRPFQLLKFRTMEHGAEDRLAELEGRNEVSGRAFKVTNDPRLTRSGGFLRRASLDELPQLWNVVRGEMSLVGPRPPLPREVVDYDVWHRRRLSMKPGMTGLWQVSSRRDPDFDRWVEKDLEYIDRWSLWLDLKIMLLTVPAMVDQQGR